MAHVFKGPMTGLESPWRKSILPADIILKQIGINPGDKVIDFGCGSGYFTFPILDLVGESGQVIAVDVSQSMLDELLKKIGVKKNLTLIKSNNLDQISIKVDYILLITVLHELDSPSDFLKAGLSKLKDGGKIVIIDWQKKTTDFGPPLEHRLSKEAVMSLVDKNWTEHDINENFYFLELQQ
jgi:ubiquinone/menaquinone biosynthesis C-methylase UbiE